MTGYKIFHYLFGVRMSSVVARCWKFFEKAEKSLIFQHFSTIHI